MNKKSSNHCQYNHNIDNANGAINDIYCALSHLITTFNLDLEGFCKSLKKQHIHMISESCKTTAAIALRTGIDRRIVAKVLANKEMKHKPPILVSILNQIELTAITNERMIKKTGINSVESIMQDLASGATTLKTIISQLSILGCIEERHDEIQFITNNFIINDRKKSHLASIASEVSQVIKDQLLQNKN